MKVAVTGGTGFVGKQLVRELVNEGHEVFVLTRSPNNYSDEKSIRYIGWLSDQYKPENELPALDAIVNLAGDSLFGYWTKQKKERILKSRMNATENVIELILKMEEKPAVLINASAVGYYGTSLTESFTEKTTTPGNDFLANVTSEWESIAKQADSLGVRVVLARFGVILGKEGALPLMAMPFKMFVGGKVGSGEQWVSWIHVDDVVGLIKFSIKNDKISGPLNVTAPQPVQNKTLSKTLASVLNKPHWIPAPSFALRAGLGEMSTLILDGQAVYPDKAKHHDYSFQHPQLEGALSAIYQ